MVALAAALVYRAVVGCGMHRDLILGWYPEMCSVHQLAYSHSGFRFRVQST